MTHIPLSPGKKAYFLSDLHLGARYFDNPREAERRVVRFLDSISSDAGAIFLVGDVLDYWYEYRYVVPRGFVRFFGKLAQLADAGVKIIWLIGNHDIWIFDYLPAELGITVVDGAVDCSIAGTRFFVTHGDDIDDSSRSFRMLRRLFRNRCCQHLFAAIHPRWTIPFAFGWSRHSRQDGMKSEYAATPVRLETFAREQSASQPDIRYFIFGHLHILHRNRVSETAEAIVLGEWISRCSYAVFDGNELDIRTFDDRPTPAAE